LPTLLAAATAEDADSIRKAIAAYQAIFNTH
jgi:hypothetical protein